MFVRHLMDKFGSLPGGRVANPQNEAFELLNIESWNSQSRRRLGDN